MNCFSTRRDFIKYFTSLGIFFISIFRFTISFAQAGRSQKSNPRPGRVVIVRHTEAVSGNGSVSSEAVKQMLSQGIVKLTEIADVRKAWLSIFSSNETIGIKVNALGGNRICTHPEIAYAVAEHLIAAGIKPCQVIIWDRLTAELEKAGFTIQKGGSRIQCFGTDSDYEAEPETSGSIGSCFSRILSRLCDAIISIPVLKDHDLSGVSINLKNFYGAIHNPNKYHDNGCDPYIADLNSHPYIKNKLRLVICDGLVAQYNGGPAYKPQWSWPYGGLLFSQDPVAVDQVGCQIIEEQRKIKGLPALEESGRPPRHIQTAAQRNLGTADLQKIEKIII